MTVERGGDWGERARPPDDLRVFDDPLEALDFISRTRRTGADTPPLGLTRGDLVRTLGGSTSSDLKAADEALHVKVDLGAVLIDGTLHWFLSHLVARRSWLRGRIVVAANAAFVGSWNVAPRAHPGDGRLDTVAVVGMAVTDRIKARRRMASGTHIPHPDIAVRRVRAAQFEFERPTNIHLDGRLTASARSLSIRVEPDAIDLWV